MLNTDRLSFFAGPGFNWFRVAFFYSRSNTMTPATTEWFMLDALRIALDNMLKG